MHPTRGVFSSPSATSSFNALAVIGKKGEQPVVMTSKATSTSISLFKFDFNGVFSKMEVYDCESPCFRGLLGVEFTNAGQIAYGKKSESVYVAHQHGVIKINPCGEFFDIDAHEAHGLAVDENEEVYFASCDVGYSWVLAQLPILIYIHTGDYKTCSCETYTSG